MILIWFRYDFDMILLWFRYGKFYDFLMVLGCLWFFDMILLWSPGGAGFVAWYALLFAQQGLACGWAYEAISGNTGPLEGGSFPLEPYLVNDVSVFKLWLRQKNFLTVWAEFHLLLEFGAEQSHSNELGSGFWKNRNLLSSICLACYPRSAQRRP